MILLAVGVWGKVSLENFLFLASEESTNAPYVLIGTGAIIVIFGLFGCYATCRGSPWMLKLVSDRAVITEMLPSDVTLFNLCFVSSVCHVFDLGVPGWACGGHLRLYLQTRGEMLVQKTHTNVSQLDHMSSLKCILLLFWIQQIKANLGTAYENAVKFYNSTDSSSTAVDTIQQSVRNFSVSLMMLFFLSDFVCFSL